jgi:hypothetical protein
MSAAEITWACTPEEVAALLRARTKDAQMTETGMWSAETRPSLDQVNEIIALAVSEMSAAIGAAVPDACSSGAQGTVALLAAMLIELSYWPEQVRSDRSAYGEYRALYDKHLVLLQECVQAGGGGADAGGVGTGLHNVPVVPAVWASTSRAPAGLLAWTRLGPWGDLPGDYWPEPENPANWRNPFQPPREPPLVEDVPVGDAPASGEVLP